MSFYFTFIIISLFFFKLACKAYDTNKIVFSICYAFAILIPAILGGYRDLSVGIDVLVYGESMFDYAKSCSSISELIDDASTREYGYFLLNYVCAKFSPDLHFFFFISELIKYGLISIVALHFRGRLNSTIFVFSYIVLFYFSGLCLMRQGLAMSICFFALIFLEKNKIVYLLLILVAWMFHSSAFIMVMFIFLDFLKKRSLSLYLNVAILLVLYVFSTALLVLLGGSGLVKENIADRYIDTGVATSKAEILIAICVLMYTFLKRKYLQKSSKYVLQTTTIYCLFFLFMSTQFEVAARVASYQMIVLLLYVPFSFNELLKKDRVRCYVIWSALFFIHFYVSCQHGLSGTIPYTSKILGL